MGQHECCPYGRVEEKSAETGVGTAFMLSMK